MSPVVKKGNKKFGSLGRRSVPPIEYKDLIQEARDKVKPFRDGQGRCFSRGGAGQDKAKKLGGGVGKVSKYAGRATYCVYQFIEIICYSRGNLDLHSVTFS